MLYDLIKSSQTTFAEQHPKLYDQIVKGTLITVAGLVRPSVKPNALPVWTVKGYKVELWGQPARWGCKCDYFTHQPKVSVTTFAGHAVNSANICKHIAAAALCWSLDGFKQGRYLKQVANVRELLERLEQTQLFPHMPDQPFDLPFKVSPPIKLAATPEDSHRIILRYGHSRSKPLFTRQHTGYDRAGQAVWQWVRSSNFEHDYFSFLERIKAK